MSTNPNLSALCWFGATCLAMTAFVLVFIGIEHGASVNWSAGELWLVSLSTVSLVFMIVLIRAAFILERR